jgi:hypothetical protein
MRVTNGVLEIKRMRLSHSFVRAPSRQLPFGRFTIYATGYREDTVKKSLVLGLTLVLAAALLAISGCCPLLQAASSGNDAKGRGSSGGPSLETFLDADSKTGDYETHTVHFGGDTFDQTGEFWVDGRMFRYDIYEDGTLVRSVISPDGVTAYFVYHDDKHCEPSVASVDYYLTRYFKPEGKGVEDGTDEETGATRVVYTVKQTENMQGSANPWYSEDVTYLVKNDEVVGVITRGAVPEDDGSIEGLDVNRELWSNVQAGVTIPAKTFELPYPVRDAE